VAVPNESGREPTREEIYQALVAAGHQQRADELADRAYGNVTGTS
jgi:ribosomal protein L15E